MIASKTHKPALSPGDQDGTPAACQNPTASTCQKALAEICKALKAISFYPEKHPLREQLLQNAFQAIAGLTQTGTVSLIVQRNGFSFADQKAIDNTPMTKVLAQELFSRELQRLAFLPELSLAELTEFLALLAISPQKISAGGGVAGMLAQSGIETIMVNEIDITAVFTRKQGGESSEKAGDQASGSKEQSTEFSRSLANLSGQQKELTIEELLASMSIETDDNRYRQLAKLLLAKGQPLKLEGQFARLYAVLTAMAEQNGDPARSAAVRADALSVLQQLGSGETGEYLLDQLEDEDFREQEMVYLILNRLGAELAPAVIRRLIAAGSNSSRKLLTTALIRIGSPAQPALTMLLKDGRWVVVQSAVAILGELGNRDAVKALALTLSHSENRVRLEAIRSLARIGGMEATTLLTALLRDKNQALAIQAATWLGNSRNQAALEPLLDLVLKLDLMGRSQPLKREALIAIGRLGDNRALEPLFRLVRRSYWIVPSRWDELKLLAVAAIGNLGGEPARLFLEQVSAGGGELARASYTALRNMTQRNADHE
jgi:HEAT repeat protein